MKRAKQKSVIERASRLFAKNNMKSRIRELLSASKLADLESLGEASQKLLEDIEAARERGNDNAVMGFTRIKMQMHGALRDAMSLSVEQRTSDAELLTRLAGDGPAKLAALRAEHVRHAALGLTCRAWPGPLCNYFIDGYERGLDSWRCRAR